MAADDAGGVEEGDDGEEVVGRARAQQDFKQPARHRLLEPSTRRL